MKSKSKITAHMVVKNEDQWVWYAIKSVLPYVDQFLITDTGSSDNTLMLIKSINSPKIELSSTVITRPSQLTQIRNDQIKATKGDWIWIIDGDEVYTSSLCEEIVDYINDLKINGIAVRRYDLLGDVYHRQDESVGEYKLLGTRGHLVTRLIKLSAFPNLHVERPYPLEAYLDNHQQVVHSYNQDKWQISKNSLFHAMYLRRSSLGAKLPMFNRSKYKIEKGLPNITPLPEVFSLPHPLGYNPFSYRGLMYDLVAAIITPIKMLKRKIMNPES